VTKGLENKKGRVAFEHLPQLHTPEGIDLARDVTVSFINGLADGANFTGS
jgi:hypothetical protein